METFRKLFGNCAGLGANRLRFELQTKPQTLNPKKKAKSQTRKPQNIRKLSENITKTDEQLFNFGNVSGTFSVNFRKLFGNRAALDSNKLRFELQTKPQTLNPKKKAKLQTRKPKILEI